MAKTMMMVWREDSLEEVVCEAEAGAHGRDLHHAERRIEIERPCSIADDAIRGSDDNGENDRLTTTTSISTSTGC